MKFHLSFEGSLPSTGNGNDANPRPAKLKAIWAIRDAIFPQLEHLASTHAAFSGRTTGSRVLMHSLIPAILIENYRFKALVKARFKVKCGLKIDLLVNHEPGSVFTKHGDLDNRLKTLLDGLRLPQGAHEIKTNMQPKYLDARGNPDYYLCLLENDVLITALDIEMQRNLSPPIGAGGDHVRANIKVTLEPTEDSHENEAFRAD
jgi:hypothetical protein